MEEKDYRMLYEDLIDRLSSASKDESIKDERFCCVINDVVPQLKESDDERIRKEIIYHIKNCDDTIDEETEKRMLAWLEKHSNIDARIQQAIEEYTSQVWNPQKPKKHEPKFKVGDWLTENEPNNYARFVQILEVVDVQGKERYRIFRDPYNDEDVVECRFVEKNYHPFTIQDAKAGDVLTFTNNECIAMFWDIYYNRESWKDVCMVGAIDKKFYINLYHNIEGTIPATKEQRDLLFQKMREAGYEWDAEKLELKKVDAEWSGEDEQMLASFLHKLEVCELLTNKENTWAIKKFASIKPQPKQEWSEEDERILQGIWDEILANKHNAKECEWKTYDKFLNWLKSLNPQPHWKPSEEQMNALIRTIRASNFGVDIERKGLLELLYNDLNQLTE